MVEKVSKVSSANASATTRIDTSISLAEPDIAWVSERQSGINGSHSSPGSRRSADYRGGGEHGDGENQHGEALPIERLSGESERIGTGNLDDDDIPFGSHTGFV
ncbi:hypothetical protein [Rhizobium leguminosarum]|uniref:hypothetical protein n=1 Tax=Rhizobium leguminosarum TaxID=384 RepID=UPI00143F2484|nr:hypothetical protein [Rhizobium leguminosarum]NKL23680.1 hypothetical protein [Rhizobium leguminosarum bv. viciae]